MDAIATYAKIFLKGSRSTNLEIRNFSTYETL